MNHPDEFAVEEAVLIKEARPDTIVDVITAGPERASQVLERAMGVGADNAIHILTPSDVLLPPFSVASCIADYARDMGYDLIFSGIMADDDNSQICTRHKLTIQ